MPLLNQKNTKWLTAIGLTIAVLATRIPFVSEMLFEFDSVNFAVATFRFSLEQVTPHFPGYILHILLARFFLFFTTDHNSVFILLSVFLSIGSVLFMWRAGAWLRGERLGVITALLWLTTPMFWFYGEVATAYIHEAFFASAILYFGIKLLRKKKDDYTLVLLLIFYSLSIAARQSSVIFFAPAIFYLVLKTRQSLRSYSIAFISFLVVTAVWGGLLFHESGGWHQYLAAFGRENVYQSQSILFGNSVREHLAIIGKVFMYSFIGSLSVTLVSIISIGFFPSQTFRFIKDQTRKSSFRFVLLVGLTPFLFYVLFYFMKAGYLLNVLPSVILCGACLLDMLAIWFAERKKSLIENRLLLTRKLITRNITILLCGVMVFNTIWFFVPLPGKRFEIFAEKFTLQSFKFELRSNQDITLADDIINRLFAYTSRQGFDAMDSIHHSVASMLQHEGTDPEATVILDTWYQRFNYYYNPKAIVYNIQSGEADTVWYKSRQHEYTNEVVGSVIEIPPETKNVLFFIRHDHPDMKSIEGQVTLERIPMPEYLDVYRITDDHFILRWKNIRIVK